MLSFCDTTYISASQRIGVLPDRVIAGVLPVDDPDRHVARERETLNRPVSCARAGTPADREV